MKKRIAIVGVGAVTPIGVGVDNMWDACINGKSGVGDITLFDSQNYEIHIAAEVKNFQPRDFMLPEVYRKTDRFAQMGVAAAKLAVEDAGVESLIDKNHNNVPVIIGSGLGGSLFHEEQIFQLIGTKDPHKVLSSSVPRIAPNAVSAYIAMQFKLRGPNFTISTACSSGGNAIAVAAQLLENGISDMAITGGVECPITPFTYAAYQSLRVLSRGGNGKGTPRPFDKHRDGFVLGEGAGILVLEDLEKAKSRGAKIYAEILSYVSNCGAYHMAAPDPTAEDATQAISRALENAGLNKRDIDYINAHGTATKINDACEAKAICKIFGYGKQGPYVSSSKSQIGHTIGAAGAIEAIITVLAIKHGIVPPNINCDELDEECNINVVQRNAIKADVKYAVSNSFGFGSNNSVLIFGKVENP
jgi:3-oxoacyl-[acyl-carrier-protein] synthase II